MKHQIVGKSVERFDAKDKVTGRALYADDIPLDDFLWGTQISSPVPHGILKDIKKDPNFDWSGFVFADYKDIPGKNEVESVIHDLPLLVEKEIKYFGQPIILIAHKDKDRLHEGVKHITIEVDQLDSISTIDQSLEKKVIIANDNNIFRTKLLNRGDTEKALSDAKYVFEATYYTPHQEQMYIEPQAMIAWWEDDKVFVKGSMQCPYYIHGGMKILFDKKDDQVIVIQATVGGAFGGKEDYPTVMAAHSALLSLKAKKTVKIVYDRSLDVAITTKRHPSKSIVKMGLDENHKIVAIDMDFILDGGAYETMSSVILARGMLHAFGPYQVENVKINGIIVATNTPPNGAFRGFGAPQSFFAIESHIDYVAKKLNIDPLELRNKHFVQKGGSFPTGQLLGDDVLMPEVYNKMIENAQYNKLKYEIEEFNKTHKTKKRGFGTSAFFHGGGFTGSGELMLESKAGIKLTKDGKVTVLVANTEMGQGAHTVLPQIVAEELNIPLEYVRTSEVNTSKVPNSGPTVASRTTMIVGEILRRASIKLKNEITYNSLEQYVEGVKTFLKDKDQHTFYATYEKPPKIVWDDENYKGYAYGTYAWAAYGVYLEVDLLTYEIDLIDMYSVMDIGEVMNPVLATGQVEGGIVQSLGYALTENIVYKDKHFWNTDFTNYIIPSIEDIPNIHVDFLNYKYSYGPYGAKGLGELPMDGGAPAVNNAIRDAIGTDLFNLPLSPEQIMEALQKKEEL